MGQQQLLLVILVTVIIGIATIVALNIFGTTSEQSNRDAVRQDLLAAAGQAQAIWARPTAMGGIGQDFTVIEDIRRLNIPRSSDPTATYTDQTIVNDNGTYTITDATSGGAETAVGSSITIQGQPNSGGDAISVVVTRVANAQGEAWDVTWPTEEGGST